MTEQDIALIIGKDRVIAGHPIVCDNVNHLLKGQQDMISMNGRGLLIEYEIKISRGDFFRDKKKGRDFSFTDKIMLKEPFHLSKIPNQFFYVVPEDLIHVDELPSWAGLYYVIDDKLKLQRMAPVIHTQKHDKAKVFMKVATLYQQRKFLGCCLLTYNNRKTIEANIKTFEKYLPEKCLSKKKRGKCDPCPFPCNSCKLCVQW